MTTTSDVAASATKRNKPRRKGAWRGLVGGSIVGGITLMAIFREHIAPDDGRKSNLDSILVNPGTDGHLLGTDELGRDLLSRIIHGSGPVITIAIWSTVIALILGVTLGVIAAFGPRAVDNILGRISDIQLSIPGIILALLALSLYGTSVRNMIIVLGLEAWPFYFRVTRTHAQNIRTQSYMEAAWLAGVKFRTRIRRHVLPGLLPTLIVSTTISISWIVLTSAGLSFLGLGVQPPTPEWGLMISLGKSQLGSAPWLSLAPAAALIILVVGIQLLGDYLSDRLAVKESSNLP